MLTVERRLSCPSGNGSGYRHSGRKTISPRKGFFFSGRKLFPYGIDLRLQFLHSSLFQTVFPVVRILGQGNDSQRSF